VGLGTSKTRPQLPFDGHYDNQLHSLTLEFMGTMEDASMQRDWRFWMIFMCVMLSQFLTALELVSSTLVVLREFSSDSDKMYTVRCIDGASNHRERVTWSPVRLDRIR
jgi:hypothetical protein